MAASTEFGWNIIPELAPAPFPSVTRKRRWDDDSQRMLQLMLGQVERSRQTLDLLGGSSSLHSVESLDLDLETPLPSGWEKCLDLKTGSIYYLNRSTGTSTCCDSRKPNVADLNSPPSPSCSQLTCEPLPCKTSHEMTLIKTEDTSKCEDRILGRLVTDDRCLDLGLRLAADVNVHTEADQHRITAPRVPEQSWIADRAWFQKPSAACVSTSSSSSSSPPSVISFQDVDDLCEPRERRLGKVSEVESIASEAVPPMMTVGCAKCLMFVMLSRTDPRCPRCGTCALLDFPQPVLKRSKLGLSI